MFWYAKIVFYNTFIIPRQIRDGLFIGCVNHTTCRNYLLIVKAWKQHTKIWMGRLPFSHVRMNYFWWAKTERIKDYSAVNLLFRNNKIQLSKCHYITIFMNCKISLTYISETHWKQSIKFQIECFTFLFPNIWNNHLTTFSSLTMISMVISANE